MVKVAFIVEGKIEKIFIDFLDRSGWFKKYNIEKVAPTIDAKGGGNLCPKNMQVFEYPEDTKDMPYDTFKEILIEKSASYPNCQSAKYFVDKIRALGK